MKNIVKIFLAILLLLLSGQIAWEVYQLNSGAVLYYPYKPNGRDRFPRIVGPMASDETSSETWVSAQDIPRHCRIALIAAEDPRFYWHHGIDFRTLASAIHFDWKRGKMIWGGSTLTQQIVKNLFLRRDKTLLRKVQEVIGSLVLDDVMSKDEQLAWYLNIAEFGPNIYGISSAAEYYYKQSANTLSLSQCVSLFSILPDPVKNSAAVLSDKIPEMVQQRRRRTVEVLQKLHLSPAMVEQAANEMHIPIVKEFSEFIS